LSFFDTEMGFDTETGRTQNATELAAAGQRIVM
jgi:hypothetical protein